MKFGEKLLSLRKERGLSQEDLAEEIGTTRQAVSKWENDQGFPEIEKLLRIANVFEVSVDYLLRDDKTAKGSKDKGYYVSRELAKGYISNVKKVSVLIGLGFMFLSFTGIPYVFSGYDKSISYMGMGFCIVLAVAFIVLGMFAEKEEYKILKREPLLFDSEYLKSLKKEYTFKKKRYVFTAIPATILFVLGLIALGIEDGRWSEYHSAAFLSLGIGLCGFTYSLSVIGAYELFIENDRYLSGLSFKIKCKIRDKIDKL